jgi:hypothetical protein
MTRHLLNEACFTLIGIKQKNGKDGCRWVLLFGWSETCKYRCYIFACLLKTMVKSIYSTFSIHWHLIFVLTLFYLLQHAWREKLSEFYLHFSFFCYFFTLFHLLLFYTWIIIYFIAFPGRNYGILKLFDDMWWELRLLVIKMKLKLM